jgi:tetratricopeptide (TPR) repeat protein
VAQAGGHDRRAAELHLHALERKDFVQRARRSSVTEEAEYSFLHLLVRDVAYGQIPRGRRAEQHRLAAEWIASLGRTEDNAEMLAHHYRNIIELRRTVGQPIDLALAEQAMASLRDAGDRAFSLNAFASASTFYQSALELAPAGSLPRARLLLKVGRTRYTAGDLDHFDPDPLAAACTEFVAADDRETAAEAEAVLANVHSYRGDRDRALEHLSRARELVEARPSSRAKAAVLSTVAGFQMTSGETADAIRLGREALAMAELLGLDDQRARALNLIGVCRLDSGEPGGIEDLERSLVIATDASAPEQIWLALQNLAATHWARGQLAQASALGDRASEAALRFGLMGQSRGGRGDRAADQYVVGNWEEALKVADEFLAEVEGGSPHFLAPWCYKTRAQIRLGRDDAPGAVADARRALELAGIEKEPQNLYPTLAACAHVFRETGDPDGAAGLADDVLAWVRAGRRSGTVHDYLHVLAWTLSSGGRGPELIEALPSTESPWVRAAALFAAGDLAASADVCAEMGAVTEEARDRLWLAERLIEKHRRAEADVELHRALAFYRSVGATRYIREAEGLLAASA